MLWKGSKKMVWNGSKKNGMEWQMACDLVLTTLVIV